MKKTAIQENRELWYAAIADAAYDDDEIIKMAKRLLLQLQLKRGKSVGLGISGALEILANLGVFMMENGD